MTSILPALCLREVFGGLGDDRRALYACALQNRHWCHNAIPYLWQKPLLYTDASYNSSVAMIDAMLNCLSDRDREKITTGTLRSPAFQYTDYLRHFDFKNLARAASDWHSTTCGSASAQFILQKLCRHLFRGEARFEEMYLDFDTSLDDYDWGEDDWNFFKFPGADLSLSSLRVLNCFGAYDPILLLSASALCTSIESIEVSLDTFGWARYQRWELMIKAGAETLVTLISVQKNLQRFHLQDCQFRGFPIDLSNIFEALRSVKDTIRHVQFSTIDMQGYALLDILGECLNLETITFSQCQNIGKSNKKPTPPFFPRLKSLLLDKTFVPVPTLRIFAINAGDSLETVLLRGDGYQENWNAVHVFTQHNPNISKFQVHGAITELHQILSMVQSWPQLESLSIMQTKDENYFENIFCAENFLSRLGAEIPETMRHLNIQLDLEFSPGALGNFFRSCQVPMRTFELPASQCISDEHLRVITELAPATLEHLNIFDARRVSPPALWAALSVIPIITSSCYLGDSNRIYWERRHKRI